MKTDISNNPMLGGLEGFFQAVYIPHEAARDVVFTLIRVILHPEVNLRGFFRHVPTFCSGNNQGALQVEGSKRNTERNTLIKHCGHSVSPVFYAPWATHFQP